mmetsp:Transcript_47565/g.136776  ORF Transcript_47565/g.136776 Transcript_47565/m.136776 type:complete len:262 (-) Transcript_47565:62-847(-)
MPRLVAALFAAAPAGALGAALRSAASTDPSVLDVPDLRAYDPVEVLCAHGKDASGKPKIQGWCQNWLSCIKKGATPAGDAAAVREAWKPADCREVCGKWPSTSAPEGAALLAADRGLGWLGAASRRDCEASCKNFQESLTQCVAKVLFEPGQIAAMGIPKEESTKEVPPQCTGEKTACLPDLPVQYQSCLAKAKDSASQCKALKEQVEDCKACPQLSENHQSHYHTFVGGCMDQLNAYWAATAPSAKGGWSVPGAAGCTVH